MILRLSKLKLSKFARKEFINLLPGVRCLKKVCRQWHVKDKESNRIVMISLETKTDHPKHSCMRLEIAD